MNLIFLTMQGLFDQNQNAACHIMELCEPNGNGWIKKGQLHRHILAEVGFDGIHSTHVAVSVAVLLSLDKHKCIKTSKTTRLAAFMLF